MAIETEFDAYLKGISAITSAATGGIWCGGIPQSVTLPAIAWDKNNCDHGHLLSGASGRAEASFDVDCRSRSLTEAGQIGELVRLALHGYRGTWGTYHIAGVFLDNDWLPCEAPNNGSDMPAYFTATYTFIVRYDETIPTFS